MSVERSNISAIQKDINLFERSMEQRLTDGETYIIVQIFNGGGDFLTISVDIIKDGKSQGIVNFYVHDNGVYSEGEWKASNTTKD